MSPGRGIDYCPYRTNIDYSGVQYSDFSHVQYYQPSDSEEDGDNGGQNQGKSLCVCVCVFCR